MSIGTEQLESLRLGFPGAEIKNDSERDFVFLPQIKVQVGDTFRLLDALLSPTSHSGYETRLFLAETIVERITIRGQPANWTIHTILGRTWHAWSIRGITENLPLSQMLLEHLQTLR